MKTANEKIRDGLIKHNIRVIDYSKGLSKKAIESLGGTEDEIEKIISFYANRLEGERLSTPKSRQLLRKMNRELIEARKVAWEVISKTLADELVEFSYNEASFVSELFAESLPVETNFKLPLKDKLRDSALQNPIQGQVLQDWIDTSAQADIKIINQRFRESVKNDLSSKDIIKSVIGTASSKRQDGVLRRAWSGQDALTVTSTNSIQNEAMTNVLDENTWMVTEERYSAILDGGTTAVCQKNDGKIFKLGKGPQPPLHFRCRSMRVPFVVSESITDRPAKPATQNMLVNEYAEKNNLGKIKGRFNLPRGHKGLFDAYERQRLDELVGQVPDITDYSDWLRDQSHEFQAEALKSKTRAALFRKEGFHIERYVDKASGEYITLKELARMGRLPSDL